MTPIETADFGTTPRASAETPGAPFFIVGSGRSGSTLLRMMLSAHSRLCIPPETWYILPLVEQFSLTEPLTPTDVSAALHTITSHYRWPDLGIDKLTLALWVEQLPAPRLSDILSTIYDAVARNEHKVRWGDKTPPYIKIVPELLVLYPRAKFIHLVRDGRDVVKSFRNTGWYGPLLHKNVSEWRWAIRCYEAHVRAGLAKQILPVHYEDLVRDTKSTLHRICTFLGETYEEGMMDYIDGAEKKIPGREKMAHPKLSRKPDETDIGRWRHEMSKWELFMTESHIGRELDKTGYPRFFKSKLWRPLSAGIRVWSLIGIPIWLLIRRGLGFVGRRVRKAVRIFLSDRGPA
ncbi:MAG: sulfotransferase family protein [Sulfobacillus sp.]